MGCSPCCPLPVRFSQAPSLHPFALDGSKLCAPVLGWAVTVQGGGEPPKWEGKEVALTTVDEEAGWGPSFSV